MFLYIRISSKCKKELYSCLKLFEKFKILSFSSQQFSQKKSKQVISVLKSPHVNKTAQEQFEYRIFSNSVNIKSFKNIKNILILNQLYKNSLSGIKVSLHFTIKQTSFHQAEKNIELKLNYFELGFRKKMDKKEISKAVIHFIQIWDSEGESLAKKVSSINT